MANTKLDRIERDIEKTRAKILEQQKKLKDLEAQKVEEENAQIVQMVKAVHLDGTQLAAFLSAYASGEITLPQPEAMILSRLVDTFISRISLTMLPVPNPHNTVCVLSGEEARHWQSRSSGYSSS